MMSTAAWPSGGKDVMTACSGARCQPLIAATARSHRDDGVVQTWSQARTQARTQALTQVLTQAPTQARRQARCADHRRDQTALAGEPWRGTRTGACVAPRQGKTRFSRFILAHDSPWRPWEGITGSPPHQLVLMARQEVG
jgi:hypothetical protein